MAVDPFFNESNSTFKREVKEAVTLGAKKGEDIFILLTWFALTFLNLCAKDFFNAKTYILKTACIFFILEYKRIYNLSYSTADRFIPHLFSKYNSLLNYY